MNIGRAQLPIPSGAQAPTTPGDFAALALAIDQHILQPVTDQADRDARYADAPVRTLTVAATGTIWAKVSVSNIWVTVHEEPEAWRTLPLTTGFIAGAEPPKIRRIGKQVWIRGRVQKTDGGNIFSDGVTKVAQVPTDCIPQIALASGAAGQSLIGTPSTGVGRVEVLPATWEQPAGGPGSVFWYSQDGSPDGAPWVGVDLNYWID